MHSEPCGRTLRCAASAPCAVCGYLAGEHSHFVKRDETIPKTIVPPSSPAAEAAAQVRVSTPPTGLAKLAVEKPHLLPKIPIKDVTLSQLEAQLLDALERGAKREVKALRARIRRMEKRPVQVVTSTITTPQDASVLEGVIATMERDHKRDRDLLRAELRAAHANSVVDASVPTLLRELFYRLIARR